MCYRLEVPLYQRGFQKGFTRRSELTLNRHAGDARAEAAHLAFCMQFCSSFISVDNLYTYAFRFGFWRQNHSYMLPQVAELACMPLLHVQCPYETLVLPSAAMEEVQESCRNVREHDGYSNSGSDVPSGSRIAGVDVRSRGLLVCSHVIDHRDAAVKGNSFHDHHVRL